MPSHSKSHPRAWNSPRLRTHCAAGALAFAVAAGATAASVSAYEPAHAEKPQTQAQPAAASKTAPAPAPKLAVPAPNVAPAVVTKAAPPKVVAPPAPVYADNLDGWIRQSLDILRANNIPASYEGIMRNIMRESTGNPQAINLYDSNAAAGIPSKGLLQVVDPTFAAYHVAGTKFDIWDPVANIVAACNYAASNYGSMDNVDSAY